MRVVGPVAKSLFNRYVKYVSMMITAQPEEDQRLDAVFSALSDPVRRQILTQLGHREATVGELAAPHPISLPAISRHLKVLERAGLITRSQQAQWRISSLRPEPLREATAWVTHLTAIWSTRFDALDAHLAVMKSLAETRPTKGDPT